MLRRANYYVIYEDERVMVLKDMGPHDVFPTITNDAENVVGDLIDRLGERKLLYHDSNGDRTELLVSNDSFAGFRHAPVKGRQ